VSLARAPNVWHSAAGQEIAPQLMGRSVSRTGRRVIVVGRLGAGYTIGMKTAISLPDDLFRAAERHAKRLRKSRSKLYAEAVAEYLARHAPDEVTEAMNRVVDQLDGPRPDPFLAASARRALERTEW